MHFLFLVIRTFPYWALPLALVLAEMGIFFRRKRHRIQYLFWGAAGIILAGFVYWLVFRGDLNSAEWVRALSFNFQRIPFDTSAKFA